MATIEYNLLTGEILTHLTHSKKPVKNFPFIFIDKLIYMHSLDAICQYMCVYITIYYAYIYARVYCKVGMFGKVNVWKIAKLKVLGKIKLANG